MSDPYDDAVQSQRKYPEFHTIERMTEDLQYQLATWQRTVSMVIASGDVAAIMMLGEGLETTLDNLVGYLPVEILQNPPDGILVL